MSIAFIVRTSMRMVFLLGVVFAFIRLAGETVSLKSENENLKIQLKMMATQAEEVVASQWAAAAHLTQLDAKLTEQAAAVFTKTHLNSQWDQVTEEISKGWGDDAPIMQEFRMLPESSFAQALTGMEAVRTNFRALEDRLGKLEDSLNVRTDVLSRLPSILPANGWVSSRYGYRKSPTTGQRDFHKGTDIAAKKGSPVVAAASGVVLRAGWNGAYGKLVEIDHGAGLSTLYAHNGRILVEPGEQVLRGQQISSVGMTGRTTGAHLHYEVRQGGVPINPRSFLRVSPQQPFDGSLAATPAKTSLAVKEAATGLEPVFAETLALAVPVTEPIALDWPDFREIPAGASVSTSVANANAGQPLAAGMDPKGFWISIGFIFVAMSYRLFRRRRFSFRDRLAMVPVQLFTFLVANPQTVNDKAKPVSYWS